MFELGAFDIALVMCGIGCLILGTVVGGLIGYIIGTERERQRHVKDRPKTV